MTLLSPWAVGPQPIVSRPPAASSAALGRQDLGLRPSQDAWSTAPSLRAAGGGFAIGLAAAAATAAVRARGWQQAGCAARGTHPGVKPLSSVLRRAEAAEAEGRLSQEQEVRQALRQVKDKGLNIDIVTAGFVSAVEVNRDTAAVTVRLEVATFQDMARGAVEKLPWVKSVDIRVPAPPPAATASQPMRPPMPQIPPALDKVKTILAVSSCKGGVGKSTVAVNLAYELQKSGLKVGIFDCDVYGPSLPVMVRLPYEPQMEMYEDAEKVKHIRPCVDPATGIKLVSFGYAGKAAVMRGSMVTGLVSQLMTQTEWGELDFLVLDLPPGTGDIHLTLAQVCKITAAVIVTTPQKLSIIDVERGISMFSQLAVPSVAVVQNMSYLVMPDGTRMYPFGKTDAGRNIADTFGIDHVFELPLEPSLAEAGDTGVPYTSRGVAGAASDEFAKLAQAVVKEVEKIHKNVTRPKVEYDNAREQFRVSLPNGEFFGIDPFVLRARDKGAGGATPPKEGAMPAEIRDMGNYAVVIRWSDGFVQVAPHKQLVYGDEKGPMPRIQLDNVAVA
mmetsp:Transcript_51939/g.148941  ORF Transcript_51939/g.148941 Transcript_51939/m.148941 type:complete len:558 (+) Transcript_51939:76-1749(+)